MTQEVLPAFDPVRFRHHLHRYPEVSSQEHKTASVITDQLLKFGLAPKTNIGGFGIVAEIDSGKPGKTTLLRADFDALPIQEQNSHDHVSRHPACMHACGHDGHTASLLSVAAHLAQNPPKSGKVILLFQPAEETGTGAKAMLADSKLEQVQPDHVFAYHNLPGHPLGQLIIKSGVFACASTGVILKFKGKTSHAAKPERGRSPAPAVARLMDYLHQVPLQFRDTFCLLTLVHVSVGKNNFGTTPGKAEVMVTIRSDDDQAIDHIKRNLTDFAQQQADNHSLSLSIEWVEPFNATVNDNQATEQVITAAQELGLDIDIADEPMRWSEDMGEFLHRWPGALFCLGAGVDHPELHNPDYDFPDELLDTSTTLFLKIIERLHP